MPGTPRAALAVATTAFLALAGLGASPAVAAPGDSGDIAVHKAGTAPSDTRDEKAVCKFSLAAFNFETVKAATWTVAPQPKSPDKPVLTGQLALLNGTGHTPDYALPNGTYELSWTIPGGVPKKKQFRIDCPIGENGPRKPSGAVAAGGGAAANVADTTATASEEDDAGGVGGPLLVAVAAGAAGVVLARWVRRRHDAS
ncbi:hypothetical protein ABZV64_27975 [Streptomyces sp. NPDC004959]|uniref:hypothetical protein n=1 Tax=unclassified Streptomyces TaxID=2593676 RepID=UPI0004C74433|nr:hypothetical protein [Streptomyces sp. NRRL F-5630]